LVSDGVFSEEGEFLPLPSLDTAAVMEVFRRLLLQRLHQAERLSESFIHFSSRGRARGSDSINARRFIIIGLICHADLFSNLLRWMIAEGVIVIFNP
jgi:hypothetical protein